MLVVTVMRSFMSEYLNITIILSTEIRQEYNVKVVHEIRFKLVAKYFGNGLIQYMANGWE